MKLTILGSNSAGNGYLLTSDKGTSLIIEAGVPFQKVNQALGGDIERVAGVLITHEHGDHARYVKQYADRGLKLYTSAGTREALQQKDVALSYSHLWRTLDPNNPQTHALGDGFLVRPFKVVHDAAEPLGFLLRHPESGYVLFVTDTHYLNKRFPPIHNYIVECNYCEHILNENLVEGRVAGMVGDRVRNSHLSIQTLQQFLSVQDTSLTSRIVLTHLSDNNSDERLFASAIQKQTRTATYCATAGLTLPLQKHPF